MFNKLLIANRGEIACRIIRTCRRLNIKTVAVFSDADKSAQHVLLADEAFHIGGSESHRSYLNAEKLVEVALTSQADAIHPGYGFLSENAGFAELCAKHNIVFVGPSANAIRDMGNKTTAREIMSAKNIAVTPGYNGQNQDLKTLEKEAKKIGYPVLIKAVSGGGGKGMRTVHESSEFAAALASTQREAKASFNDDRVLLEKFIENPRHIEVQVFADSHGNFVHLFERDCSVQRRHQKIIEEAPGVELDESLRQQLTLAATDCAKAIDYTGAGTVEFLVDKNNRFYFMEMNTRLQVEHPVTEMITGIDLVEWQLRIAANEQLPMAQNDIQATGHAIEVRIYAEDPEQDFLPAIGKIEQLLLPDTSEAVRIDSGVISGDSISQFYDPMIAKLIVHATDRALAIKTMQQALSECHVLGLKTNLSYLRTLFSLQAFIELPPNTGFIEQNQTDLHSHKQSLDEFSVLLAAIALAQPGDKAMASPWNQPGWRMNLSYQRIVEFSHNDTPYRVSLTRCKSCYRAVLNDNDQVFDIELQKQSSGSLHSLSIFVSEQHQTAQYLFIGQTLHLITNGEHYNINFDSPFTAYEHQDETEASLRAPMPATVTAIMVNQGQNVAAGDRLLVLEAMKMEHTISAPHDGIVKDVYFKVGERVDEGTELVEFEVQA